MAYKTEWDLGHIYKGDIKRQVAKDLAKVKTDYLKFAKKYRKDKKHLKNDKALATALLDYERLSADPSSSRPFTYFGYRKRLNGQDSEAQAELAKLSDFFANLANEVEFFMLEVGKIDKNLQVKFLKSKNLAPFQYLLKKIFENSKHTLSEAEEKIINLKSTPAHGMWVSGFSKLLSKQTVEFEGGQITLEEVSSKLQKLPKDKRRELDKAKIEVLKSVSDFAESELNAVITDKKIEDKLRGFKSPYEATVKGYENEARTVKELVDVVTKNFDISHKFYKIKAEILGEKKMKAVDRIADIGDVSIKIPFEEAVVKTAEAFGKADPDFKKFALYEVSNGFVDAFPKKGKRGGAFCSGGVNMPTFIFLNHTDDFRSLTTLAHEMGHAIHYKYSKIQRPLYEESTIASAEVASTFFENLIFEEALKNLSPEDKFILLHDKISSDIATIFRQIACFNFENELHERVRKEGFLQKEEIAKLMAKHMQSYMGPSIEFTEDDGYSFVSWPHIRNFFYVYSYAFGQLISDSLYVRYREDKSKIKDVIKFLSAGGSQSPENIFRSIGINPNKKFFEKGLQKISKDIDEFENLWKSIKSKK